MDYKTAKKLVEQQTERANTIWKEKYQTSHTTPQEKTAFVLGFIQGFAIDLLLEKDK